MTLLLSVNKEYQMTRMLVWDAMGFSFSFVDTQRGISVLNINMSLNPFNKATSETSSQENNLNQPFENMLYMFRHSLFFYNKYAKHIAKDMRYATIENSV